MFKKNILVVPKMGTFEELSSAVLSAEDFLDEVSDEWQRRNKKMQELQALFLGLHSSGVNASTRKRVSKLCDEQLGPLLAIQLEDMRSKVVKEAVLLAVWSCQVCDVLSMQNYLQVITISMLRSAASAISTISSICLDGLSDIATKYSTIHLANFFMRSFAKDLSPIPIHQPIAAKLVKVIFTCLADGPRERQFLTPEETHELADNILLAMTVGHGVKNRMRQCVIIIARSNATYSTEVSSKVFEGMSLDQKQRLAAQWDYELPNHWEPKLPTAQSTAVNTDASYTPVVSLLDVKMPQEPKMSWMPKLNLTGFGNLRDSGKKSERKSKSNKSRNPPSGPTTAAIADNTGVIELDFTNPNATPPPDLLARLQKKESPVEVQVEDTPRKSSLMGRVVSFDEYIGKEAPKRGTAARPGPGGAKGRNPTIKPNLPKTPLSARPKFTLGKL